MIKTMMYAVIGIAALGLTACATVTPSKYTECKPGGTGYWNVAPQADTGNPGNPGSKCFKPQ